LSPVSFGLAQGVPGISGENPESEFRQEPFKIKLSGFINTKPDEESLAVVTLGIGLYRETYQFEVVKAEAIDYPRVSAHAILQQVRKHTIDFDLIGPKEMLSKIGQAEPGTPLALVGMYRPRDRTLQLLSVSILGMDSH